MAASRRPETAGPVAAAGGSDGQEGEPLMAAMKPRTGDGPLEVTKEGRASSCACRWRVAAGWSSMTPDEATALGDALTSAVQ